ncbi:MAG: hypothetical protein WBA10_21960 [Elainellaceae cyanobacterium]
MSHAITYADDRPSLPISGRPLDFCLLAVCSCLLSLMCHQTGGVASQTVRAATATPPQIDFVIKAGLATAPRQGTEVSEEEDA